MAREAGSGFRRVNQHSLQSRRIWAALHPLFTQQKNFVTFEHPVADSIDRLQSFE